MQNSIRLGKEGYTRAMGDNRIRLGLRYGLRVRVTVDADSGLDDQSDEILCKRGKKENCEIL